MNRLLPSLAVLLALALAACRSTAPPTLEVVGPRIARLNAGPDAPLDVALDVVPRAGARVGYDWSEVRREEAQVILRSPPEQAFFTMVGEQVRFEEATVRLREDRGAVEVHVDATLVHGPPGGPFQRKERVGQDWYGRFFEALEAETRAALEALDAARESETPEDDDATAPEA